MYDRPMNRLAVRLVGLLGLGILLAQAGHLLAYQLEFGAGARAVQSQGAHGYFPAFAKTGLGLLAVALLASLLIVGISRLLPGRPVVFTGRGPSYISLLSALFTIQIVFFIAQETAESLAGGLPAPSVLSLILLGSIGQLPVAAVAALAIKWLAVRVDAALRVLRAEPAVTLVAGWPVSLPILAIAPVFVPALAESCPAAYIKRGPPAFLRV
jgi:hypothetical protein